MPLSMSGRKIVITRDDGSVAFDTDEGLFTSTDFFSGSIVLPQRQAISDENGPQVIINANVDHAIGSCHPDADTCIGMMKTTWDGVDESPFGSMWTQVSGSYLDVIGAIGAFSSDAPDLHRVMTAFGYYTFRAAGGAFWLNERVSLKAWTPGFPATWTYTRNQCTVDYRIYVGLYV